MNSLLPLMLVPLLVWVAVWGYLWNLDARVKRLHQQMTSTEPQEDDRES